LYSLLSVFFSLVYIRVSLFCVFYCVSDCLAARCGEEIKFINNALLLPIKQREHKA